MTIRSLYILRYLSLMTLFLVFNSCEQDLQNIEDCAGIEAEIAYADVLILKQVIMIVLLLLMMVVVKIARVLLMEITSVGVRMKQP